MNAMSAMYNRMQGANAYVEKALDDLEDDLLRLETADQIASRVHDILRIFRRLKDGPTITIEQAKPKYTVILDPEGD